MNESFASCAQVQELAPELALGTLPGDERAVTLVHLEHCGECQLLVEELSDAADALLLLAPEADPPPGFARQVTSRLEPRQPRRRQRAVAVAVAATLVLGLGVGIDSSLRPGGRSAPRFALTSKGVRTAPFVAASGEKVRGQVFSYRGSPSWVFMTVHERGSAETYICELELTDGSSVRIGSFQLHDGVGSWGRSLGFDTGRIRTVRLLKTGEQRAASASFL